MIPNSISQWRKKALNPFIFEKVKVSSDKKSLQTESESFLLVNTKPSSNDHLPFPKDFTFESCLLPTRFKEFADKIRNFKVKKDDVWILSYPDSGTTWVQNIVWQLKHGIDQTKEPISSSDALYLDGEFFVDSPNEVARKNLSSKFENSLERVDNEPSPRIIISHLPPNLLPVDLWTIRPKIIYIARNPKDVAVSMFHMLRDDFKHFSGTIEEYLNLFLEERNWYAPFFAHCTSFWQLRNENNFLFLSYEDVMADRFKGVKRVSEFLHCSNVKHELKLLNDYLPFENTQIGCKGADQDSNNRSYRERKLSGFKDEMSEEFIKKFDEWTASKLKDSDFKFNV
ncbi:sulfotransferase 4A1-like [Sitodiplosis mosellana]|uniref:sulfotransferase 4A1-like n=1 Tax=Sitodiplosis mosellana TaxID=263140 RepID=UPI00244411C0|nr:sulfotransferase 4A1-like [Sitodiplosis mosellana]